jgi:DNA-binding GntR family transcriptional regulator
MPSSTASFSLASTSGRTLADHLSVSRRPIREALRQSEQESLIVSMPNQGCFVRRFDEKDIEEESTLGAERPLSW